MEERQIILGANKLVSVHYPSIINKSMSDLIVDFIK